MAGTADRITSVGETIHLVEGPSVNWVVLTDGPPGPGAAYTLVDAGYPGYVDRVRRSLRTLGLVPDGLAAVLVTHGHVDHVGGIPALLGDRAVPVHTSAAEVPHLHGEVHESAGPADLVVRLHQPRVLPWAWGITRAGAASHVSVPSATAVADGEPVDVPGRPVPLTTPGHTSGHTCWHLPEAGVLLTGDALVTGHPLSADPTGPRGHQPGRPQVLRDFFHHDVPAMLASLEAIAETGARTLLPGHGPRWLGSAEDAADQACLRAETDLRGARR